MSQQPQRVPAGMGFTAEEGPFCCRVCLVEQEDLGDLVAPCQCTGTQKFVHMSCLRTWQEQLQKRDVGDGEWEGRVMRAAGARLAAA